MNKHRSAAWLQLLHGSALRVGVVRAVLLGAVTLAVALPAAAVSARPAPAAHGSSPAAAQGYLGIEFHDMPTDAAPASAHATHAAAVEVVMVDHDGPAGQAGLQPHDIITSLDGHPVSRAEDLRRMIRECAPGRVIQLTVVRVGQMLNLSARMANREELEHRAWLNPGSVPAPGADDPALPPGVSESFMPAPAAPAANRSLTGRGEDFIGNVLHMTPYTGAELTTLTPQLSTFFGAPPRTGLLVQSIAPGSPAAMGGLHAGDIVLRVNGVPVRSASDWMKQVRGGRTAPLRLNVLRDHHDAQLVVDLAARRHSMLEWPHWP